MGLVTGGLALAGAGAGVQYLRSWLLFGSPLWPLKIEIAGSTLFRPCCC
jgi:hypothetical protein